MKEGENLQDILKQIKDVDKGINSMIVPMLKDTINDYKKTFNKMVIIVIILLVGLFGVAGYSQYLIAKQNDKYQEFLSQFEFESETVYQSTEDYSDINSGININN